MKASKFHFTNYSNALFYALCIALLVIINSGLSLVLQHQNEQVGLKLAKQLQQPLANENQLIANTPFTLAPNKNSIYIEKQKHYFSANSKGILLYSWPVWYSYSYLFLIINAVLLLAMLCIRRFKKPKTIKNSTITSKRQQHFNNKKVRYAPKVSSLQLAPIATTNVQEAIKYNVFALIQCECHFDANTDLQATLKVLLAKDFINTTEISVKLLTAGNFAFTLKGIDVIDKLNCAKYLHQCIVSAAYVLAPRTAQRHVKVGLCTYYSEADQVMVYQLAKSALTLSQQNRVKHYHQLALNYGHVQKLDRYSIPQRIEKQKLAILFQPVYELYSGAIIKHHVLIKSNNKANSQGSLCEFYNQDEALMHDKAVVMQVKKLLLIDNSSSVISIKLHPRNWFNSEFWSWLSSHVGGLKKQQTLQFSINELDFLNNQLRLQEAFSVIAALNFSIIIDDVRNSKSIFKFTPNKQISGVNLAAELVHAIEGNNLQQKYVKDIMHRSKLLSLSVFSLDVETPQELQFLKEIGISGAQGGYFSKLLPNYTQVAFH
ncbi:EAL domain-containing protein [Pseudoalteromonas sp.]|uniref:EAL domain-containing protein n=1 Tax=Pseudoalteromonas sp. TaxID=53249 RepID=UPI001BCEDB5D|nr:EAL domain-containing protein [Pseudoalteromonas sp.]